MATIIQKGNTHKRAVCKHCECVFLYQAWEIYKNGKHYYVHCPDCFSANIVEEEKETIIEDADDNGK